MDASRFSIFSQALDENSYPYGYRSGGSASETSLLGNHGMSSQPSLSSKLAAPREVTEPPAVSTPWDPAYKLSHVRTPTVSTPAPTPGAPKLPSTPWGVRKEPEVNKNMERALQNLNKEVEAKDQVITQLKLENEALVVGMTMSQSSDNVGIGLDGTELAHRMLSRLRSLRAENERLMNAASQKHTAQLELELDRLKQENTILRQKFDHR